MRRLVLNSLVVLAACGERPMVAVQPPAGGQPSKIVVTPATASFVAGSTETYVATVTDSAGNVLSGQPVMWESSAPNVATVSSAGVVTARSSNGTQPGMAYITTSVGGISASASARVASPMGPRITSFIVSPSTVVVGANASTASARVIDASAGIDSVRVFFSVPSGDVYAPERSCAMRLASGSKADGTWTCALSWELNAPPGRWMLTAVTAEDASGRSISFFGAEARATGATSSVTVLASSSDTTPPELTGFTMASRSVSLNASASIATAVRAVDSGTGIAQIVVELADAAGFPTNGSACGMHFTTDPTTWTCTMPLSSTLGAHPVKSIELVDRAGNARVYTNSQLLLAGYQASLTVTP